MHCLRKTGALQNGVTSFSSKKVSQRRLYYDFIALRCDEKLCGDSLRYFGFFLEKVKAIIICDFFSFFELEINESHHKFKEILKLVNNGTYFSLEKSQERAEITKMC